MKDFSRFIASFLVVIFILQPLSAFALTGTLAPTPTVGFNGNVNAIVTGADGTVYVGGTFTAVGSSTPRAVIYNTATGNKLSADSFGFQSAQAIISDSIIPDGSGGWYAINTYGNVGSSTPTGHLVHLSSSGALDTNFNGPSLGTTYNGISIAKHGGRIYLSSEISYLDTDTSTENSYYVPRRGLAIFDATTGAEIFSPYTLSGASTLTGGSLAVLGDTLYVGGSFTQVASTALRIVGIDTATGARVSTTTLQLDGLSGNFYASPYSGIVSDGSGGWYLGRAPNGSRVGVNGTNFLGSVAKVTSADILDSSFTGQSYVTSTATFMLGPTARDIVKDGPLLYVGMSGFGIGANGSILHHNFGVLNATSGLDSGLSIPAFDGAVNAVALNTDGTLYVGGAFTNVGTSSIGILAVDKTTGTRTSTAGIFSVGSSGSPVVTAVISDGSGGWYIGGNIYIVNGARRDCVAHILSDYTLDSAFNIGVASCNSVNDLVLDSASNTLYVGGLVVSVGSSALTSGAGVMAVNATTGKVQTYFGNTSGNSVQALAYDATNTILYVGGTFTSIDGVTRNRMAAYNTLTKTLTTFNPNFSGGYVDALILSGTTLYAGGTFTSLNGGTTRNRIAGIDTTTGTATSFDPNVGSSIVSDLLLSGTTLYAGGTFTTVNGATPRNNIAGFDTTTGTATSFDPNVNGAVNKLALSGTTLYAGGAFTTASSGATTRNRVASFSTSDSSLQSLDPSITGGSVFGLAISGSNLFISGGFYLFNSTARNAIAAFSTSTMQLTSFNPNVNSTVNTLLLNGTSTLFAGGSFTSVNTGGTVATRGRLASFDLNTSTGTVTSFNPNMGGTVNTLAISTTTIYAGGTFTAVNGGTTRNRLAGFDTTTGTVTSFDPNLSSTVHKLLMNGTSTLYAGGEFLTSGATSRSGFASFNLDTGALNSLDPSFPCVSMQECVKGMAVYGSNLYIIGTFMGIHQVTRNRITAFSLPDMSLLSFDPNVNGNVNFLVATGTTLYAGGAFTTVNNGGSTRNRIAGFDTTTGLPTTFDPNVNGTVNSIDLQGSTLYAGGSFTSVNTGGTVATRNRVAGFDTSATGTVVSAFDPNVNGTVNSVKASSDTLYVGGTFTTVNGATTRNNVAGFALADGVVTSFNPNLDNQVYSMGLSGSSLFLSGSFLVSNQVARNRIAAINSSGVLTSFNPNVAGTVSALALYGTSTLFAGGSFTSVNTGGTVATRNRLASFDLNTSTGTVTSFNPNMGNSVLALAVDPTSSLIYAGGTFTTGGGQSRSKLAALDITTGTANSFNPSIQNGQVNALVLDGTATLYAGGSFTFIGSSSSSARAGFAGINTSSSLVTSLDVPLFGSASALALNVPSSTLYVGGYFDYVGASARNYLAGINTSNGTVTSFNPNMNSTVSALAYDPATMVLYAGGLFTTTGSSSTIGFASINTLTGNLSSFIANLWPGWSTVSSLAFDGNGVYAGGGIVADNTYSFAKFVDAPSNTAPSATIGTPAQISASSTTRFTAVVSDTNSDVTSLLIQYSTDNSTWASTTLGTVTANTGTATGATGIISSIDTNSSSSVTLTIDWLSGTDIPNTDDTTVYLRIKPYDGTAYASAFTTSSAFAVDTASPTAPGALTSNTIGSTTAVLNLPTTTSTDTNFLDYKIYYSTSSPVTTANTAFTSSTDSDLASATFNNTTTTTITGLTSNTTYYFKLFAFDTFGNSTSSAQISGTTTVPPATQPTNFSATSIGLSSIGLSWDSTGDSYMVENVTDGTTATTTATSMTLTGLSCLRTYSLRIRAYDSLGVSTSYTSPIQVTTINCGGGGGGSSSGGGGGGGSSYVAPVVPGGSNSSGFGVSQSSISIAQLQHQASILQEQLNSMGGGRDLQVGDMGPDVISIQKILVAKGLLKMPKGEGFGYFGGLTKAAVMAFQKSQGISRTGVVGPKTRAALLFGSTSTNSSATSGAAAPSSFKFLQQTLNKLGFVVAKTGPGSIGNETNVFGNATKEALIKFQIEYGIIKNANSQGAGVYGPKTKEKIAELAK